MFNEKGFGSLEIIIGLVLALLVGGTSYYIWHSGHKNSPASQTNQLVNSSDANSAQFSGQVMADDCARPTTHAPIGDVGCSITVGNKVIGIVHGNMRYPNGWGSIRGFTYNQDITGQQVRVYARQNGSDAHYYDLGGSQYYVQLVN